MLQHIILTGFKRVGKTCIGQQLAQRLKHGFIEINSDCLQKIITGLNESCVIALCDEAALNPANQDLIKSHIVIHVTAACGTVFERIMMRGRPVFFHSDQDILETFLALWNKHDPAYRKLTAYTIHNNYSLEHAVNQAISCLQRSMAAIPQLLNARYTNDSITRKEMDVI